MLGASQYDEDEIGLDRYDDKIKMICFSILYMWGRKHSKWK